MRIRTVKPEWIEDDRLVEAGSDARVLSIALILMADDYGRGRLSLSTAARVFPLSPESFRESLARLSDWFVRAYEVRGQRYYEIVNWSKHQKVDKPGKPQVPGPEEAENVEEMAHSRDSRESVESPRESLAPDLGPGPGPGPGVGPTRVPARPPPPEQTEAQERPRTSRRRDPLDFHGAPADNAQAALSAARVAAGLTPLPRGGFAAQSAWAQAACDAAELAEAMSVPVATVLETAARGFVAQRGAQANPVWWHERFAEYFDAGRKRTAPKQGVMQPLPAESDYEPTSDEELDRMFGPEVMAS